MLPPHLVDKHLGRFNEIARWALIDVDFLLHWVYALLWKGVLLGPLVSRQIGNIQIDLGKIPRVKLSCLWEVLPFLVSKTIILNRI
jgi:hypothetical protein